MKAFRLCTLSLLVLLLTTLPAWAQQAQADDGSRFVLVGIIALVAAMIFAVVLVTADNFMHVKAHEVGIQGDDDESRLGILPTSGDIFRSKVPDYVPKDRGVFDLKKGMNILLEGRIENDTIRDAKVSTYAVLPTDFTGIAPIPKMVVEVGQEVKAGDPLFYDKSDPGIKYVAPVSGEIAAINRGAKRAIEQVVILADKGEMQYRKLPPFHIGEGSREQLVDYLKETGVWPSILSRPFNVVADAARTPDHIYISTFDTGPLAPDLNVVVQGNESHFQAGLDVLNQLTDGKVFLGLDAGKEESPSAAFTDAVGVEKRWFRGKHPAGNVGIHIHHLTPMNGDSNIWTLDVQAVVTLGKIFTQGRYDASRVVGISGQCVSEPHYVHTHLGANVGDLVQGYVQGEDVRIIAGDVLTGRKVDHQGFLGSFTDQITVIPEGDDYEMFGWLLPSSMRPTHSRTFFSSFIPNLRYETDTNTHGEKRAFVMTAEYDNVVPMDLYPQQLLKAILVQDFEEMEGLGIYEVVEEDLALCEFVCTSKQPVQKILRGGINLMLEQL